MDLLKFIWQCLKPYRLYIFGVLSGILIVTLTNNLEPLVVKKLIDSVTKDNNHQPFLYCLLYAGLNIIEVGGWQLNNYCLTKYCAYLPLDISTIFIKKLYNYPYHFFTEQLTSSLTAKLNDLFSHIPLLVFTLIYPFGYFIISIIISLILLAKIMPMLAMIMLTWLGLFAFFTAISLKKSLHLNEDYADKRSTLLGLIGDYLANIIAVKTFTNRELELKRLTPAQENFAQSSQRQGFYYMQLYGAQGLITTIIGTSFMLGLIVGFKKGQVTAGDFALVLMVNLKILHLIFVLIDCLRSFIIDWGVSTQALKLLSSAPLNLDPPGAKALNLSRGQIEFKNVTFAYEPTIPLFTQLSINIPAGQKVGLVGSSGGGKSTFVNLILKLYEISAGAIYLDGQNIQNVKEDSLRAQISLIPQEPWLFHRSILENIQYGKLHASLEEVIAAAKQAQIHDFINSLPTGYHSLIGERGVKLSGGQKQRIALARAILKNAPIFILDEATSQLDSLTENDIQITLTELMQHKTTIVIAHRLSTLLYMDRILVFADGQIIEDGTHEELLQLSGLYYALWYKQLNNLTPLREKINA